MKVSTIILNLLFIWSLNFGTGFFITKSQSFLLIMNHQHKLLKVCQADPFNGRSLLFSHEMGVLFFPILTIAPLPWIIKQVYTHRHMHIIMRPTRIISILFYIPSLLSFSFRSLSSDFLSFFCSLLCLNCAHLGLVVVSFSPLLLPSSFLDNQFTVISFSSLSLIVWFNLEEKIKKKNLKGRNLQLCVTLVNNSMSFVVFRT